MAGRSPAAILFDTAGNAIGVVLDGAVYRLQAITKVLNSGGTQVDPATEGTLSSIKDTDGIKKITEQLPAGTNEIGAVAQGTKAAGSAAWPTVLYDASGNAVGVTLNNSIYRIEGRSSITSPDGANDVDVILDSDNGNVYRLQTEALTAPGSTVNIGTGIPSNPSDLIINLLEESGGSSNMLVNGATTPVVFEFAADPTSELAIGDLLVVFAADDFEFDGASFGPNPLLTNGIEIETYIGGVTTQLFTIVQNEDFLRLPGRPPIVNNTGPKDILAAALSFGGLVKLAAGSADVIRVRVNDNLTSVKYKYLTATVYAVKE